MVPVLKLIHEVSWLGCFMHRAMKKSTGCKKSNYCNYLIDNIFKIKKNSIRNQLLKIICSKSPPIYMPVY